MIVYIFVKYLYISKEKLNVLNQLKLKLITMKFDFFRLNQKVTVILVVFFREMLYVQQLISVSFTLLTDCISKVLFNIKNYFIELTVCIFHGFVFYVFQ